jgi:hypothetical protein
MNEKPISEAYWVVPECFLAGGYPASTRGDDFTTRQRLTAFLKAGFNTYIDLTREDELPPYLPILQEEAGYYGISIDYQRLNIQDRGLPSRSQMAGLLDTVDMALDAGRKVFMHCWGGVGRTGTAVGCWLVRHGMTGEAAFIRLGELYRTSDQSSLFPRSPETDAQVKFILDWKD